MRTNFFFFGIALSIPLGMPAWAQVDPTQQQTTTAPITQEQAPAMPSLQDIRGPLNTISNRPRAITGTQSGAAPGARTAFPGSDLQERIKEFEFEQLQRDLQAEQRERNEFQQFVMQAIGRDLPMFGANLFRTVPSTFAPVDNIPVAADYVVGPGDEIQIRAWGQIDVDYNASVDRDGTISVPKVGVINVAGIKASDLPAFLKTVFGRTFRNFQLTATLGRLRSIQIFVVGQAKRPGTYTVSSLSTVVSAVFAAGGPSTKGSMRNIQLKRGNLVVAEFDLYDLLL
ncbi:MAG TPA: polysaccharide biosynthesis/export family protein, partial [Burkholderiales bacterium]|nr:polysaccharide biosynthesis/export family protein [Burkholderiales bacterium]